MAARPCTRSTCTCWPARRSAGSAPAPDQPRRPPPPAGQGRMQASGKGLEEKTKNARRGPGVRADARNVRRLLPRGASRVQCRDGAPDHKAFVDAGGLLAGPQPGGLHVDPGEPVRAAVERALLVAADPAGEAHLASGDQFRRVVEARAAGEETAISHVRYRAPAGGEAVGFDFHADRVAAGFHLDDATA